MRMKMIGNIDQASFQYTDLNVQVLRVVTYDTSTFTSSALDTTNSQWGYFLTSASVYRIQFDPLLFDQIVTLPPEFNAQGLLVVDSSTHTLYCVGYNGVIVPISISPSIKTLSIYFIIIVVGFFVVCPIICLVALMVNFQKLRTRINASRLIENDMRRLLTEMVATRRNGDHQEWIIDMSELKITSRIAEGASGVVFKGTWRGTTVAIKKLKGDNTEIFEKEAGIMWYVNSCVLLTICSGLRHPNVVLFLGVCLQEETQLIVVEWVSNGSLDQILYKRKIRFTFKQKVRILLGVCAGMMYLHGMKPPILHRDLKPQNILVC
jgi:hypothetical protein